jgi:predicted nucleotidyltransferase
MTQQMILAALQDSETKQKLHDQGIEHLSLFGSWAKGNATDESDVDILYQNNKPLTLSKLVLLRDFLQVIL